MKVMWWSSGNDQSLCKNSKLAQKEYKTRHDWVGEGDPLGIVEEIEIYHSAKWCAHNPESILENETLKFFRDFEIQTSYLILTRQPDRVIVNQKRKKERKRTCRTVGFTVLTDHRVKIKENDKRDRNLDLARELKNL